MLSQAISSGGALPAHPPWNGPSNPREPLPRVIESVAHICHDLRHPLAAILANAESLSQPRMDEMQRNEIYLEVLQAVNWMNEMISSLLEFSRGRGPLRLAPESIVASVRRAVRLVSARREFCHISIEHRHSGVGAGWFDSNRLERVVANLVLNACEAVSPDSGRIVITTAATRTSLQMSIWDNGPGVPSLIEDLIFHPFVRAGKAGGCGLGLAIARNIVRDHGGEIWLDKSSRSGAQFKITIPISPPKIAGLASSDEKPSRSRLRLA